MKKILLILLTFGNLFAQSYPLDGRITEQNNFSKNDLNGSGTAEQISLKELIAQKHYHLQTPPEINSLVVSYSSFWSSPAGAFSNCWDGAAGYFDNDTLLDIAGYTFNPNMFYIWEQTPAKPDSFALVFSYTKTEFGGFGPMAVGDIDGDGKIDFVLSDFSTLSRIYIISNTGNNTYVSRETQNTIVHPNDGYSAAALLIGDLNKNGQKEIICMRGASSPTTAGMLRIWEHSGGPGSFNFTNLYTYNTVSYLFGKSGIGDSDGDGWDEVFLTYGGVDVFNSNIRKIRYDSASSQFVHEIFTAPSIGFPSSYKVADVNGDGTKELISTNSSNGRAACYIYKSTGPNQYMVLDSIFENSDPNTMMTVDTKFLTGEAIPTILTASFGGKVYMYKYDGTHYPKIFENDNYPGSAIRRVYWLPWTGYDGYFNTWSSTSSNGTFYLFKKDVLTGITNNHIPSKLELKQNYPNPFNPNTIINYQLAVNSIVKLNIYDVNGKLIETLVNAKQNPGNYNVTFDGKNYASGIYFYKFSTEPSDRLERSDGYTEVKKMVLIK